MPLIHVFISLPPAAGGALFEKTAPPDPPGKNFLLIRSIEYHKSRKIAIFLLKFFSDYVIDIF
jgi:hypothetical protein